MKTSFKRFAALALAAIMVLGTMNLSAMGAVGNRTLDSKLVISGLDKGDVVRFYQVFQEDEDAVADRGWAYTPAFSSMSTPVSTITGNPAISKSMALTAEIAGNIAALTVAAEPIKIMEVTDDSGKVEWSADPIPPAGMYVAIITPANPDTVYNPVFVSADYVTDNPSASWDIIVSSATYSDKAAAKKTTLQITKSASTDEDEWDDGGTANKPQSEYTTAIGDSVDFYVNTTVPGYGKAAVYPSFELSDTLDALELIQDTLHVYKYTGGTKGDEIPATAFSTIRKSSDGYTLAFTKEYLQGLKAPLDIRVEYKALVTTDAADNVNVENNTVKVKFSTNPSNSTDFTVKKDETNHYTFSIDANSLFEGEKIEGSKGSELVKIGLDAAGKPIKTSRITSEVTKSSTVDGPLEGATFKLFTDPDCNNEYKPKDPATGIRKSEGLSIVSGPDGRFNIPGLDAGTYYLKETDAPDGFIKSQEIVKIVIDTTFEEKTIDTWYYNDGWYDSQAKAEAIARSQGYADTIPTSGSGRTVAEVVKKVTYKTDVLKTYKVLVGGKDMTEANMQQAALYTFGNSKSSTEIHYSISDPVELPFSIPNTQGVELPSTGGVGTTIFYMGGAVLVLLAGVLLVSKRRIA